MPEKGLGGMERVGTYSEVADAQVELQIDLESLLQEQKALEARRQSLSDQIAELTNSTNVSDLLRRADLGKELGQVLNQLIGVIDDIKSVQSKLKDYPPVIEA